jgi:hypothetical protein
MFFESNAQQAVVMKSILDSYERLRGNLLAYKTAPSWLEINVQRQHKGRSKEY